MTTTSTKSEESLSREDIAARVARLSTGVIGELYSLAHGRLEEEERRHSSLDTRAAALLSTAGLSMTLALTLLGFFLQNPDYLQSLGRVFTILALLVFAFTFGFGIASAAKGPRTGKTIEMGCRRGQ